MKTSSTQADSTIDKAVSILHSVIDDAAGKAHSASNKAANAGSQAAIWVNERSEKLTSAPKKLIEDASGYVSANPLKSVGVAIVAALLVGRLLR